MHNIAHGTTYLTLLNVLCFKLKDFAYNSEHLLMFFMHTWLHTFECLLMFSIRCPSNVRATSGLRTLASFAFQMAIRTGRKGLLRTSRVCDASRNIAAL